MKTKVLIVGIILAMILIAGCSTPKLPEYKKVCSIDSGNITAKAALPDTTGWGGTKYTVTLDYNTTYETTAINFAKAKVGGYMTNEICWNEEIK